MPRFLPTLSRLALTTSLLLISPLAQAQWLPLPDTAFIEANSARGLMTSYGTLWYNVATGSTGLEVPKRLPGARKLSTVYAANLWIGGLDAANTLYMAGETYRQGAPPSVSFWCGPVADSTAPSVGLLGDPAYNYVWEMSRAEINTHILASGQPGYQPSARIAAWPGRSLTRCPNGGAPFVNVGGDSLRYEPELGDYPDIPGEVALFTITNDHAARKEPYTPAIGLEVHTMVSAYASANGAAPVDSTILVRYTLYNRSAIDYHDVWLGHWVDFDIGNPFDDYIGCDRNRQMMYGYNSTDFDSDTVHGYEPSANGDLYFTVIAPGYGANPPAQGVVLLSDSLAGFTYYNNNINVYNGNPAPPGDYYNYLRGRWRDGIPITYGGDGRNGGGAPTPYMFDGDPVAGTGWTEQSAGNPPGDRRGLATAGPYTFGAGQSRVFELAYVFARSRGLTRPFTSITALRRAADQIRTQYVTHSFPVTPYATAPAPVVPTVVTAISLALVPNPTAGRLTAELALPAQSGATALTVRDALGRIVRTVPVAATAEHVSVPLDLRGLAPGIYLTILTDAAGRALAHQRLALVGSE